MKLKRFLFGLLLSGAIGLVAERRGSLTKSGAAGALLTGTTIFGFGGIAWGLTLIYFFLSSTFLSHFREREKSAVAADKFSKGSKRDLGQALANAGVASAVALSYGLRRRSPVPRAACRRLHLSLRDFGSGDTSDQSAEKNQKPRGSHRNRWRLRSANRHGLHKF